MNVADLVAAVKRFPSQNAASRALGIPRATIYGILKGYGRKGRPRKSPTVPRSVEQKVARAAREVVLVKLYARAVQVKDGDDGLVADINPEVLDVVYGDHFDEVTDDRFIGINFAQDAPLPKEDAITGRYLDRYFIEFQQSLEQKSERPQRPMIKRSKGPDGPEHLGSPQDGVIIAYLFRLFYAKDQRGYTPQPRDFVWTEPSARLKAEQAVILGGDKVDLAYETYETYKPDRPPR